MVLYRPLNTRHGRGLAHAPLLNVYFSSLKRKHVQHVPILHLKLGRATSARRSWLGYSASKQHA